MRLEKLVGDRFKERPADCVIDSHALMVRGGYIKQVGNGIYSSYTVLRRITHKIEEIIRQEMESIDGQEVQFPVVVPASLWEESGRYFTVNAELARFKDRNDTPMVLGMTHEEPAVHLVREYGQTYAKYPFMIYQIQTKFRDEARPRAGLIRVREFVMKDGYSYHTSQEDLDTYYESAHKAYERIFARVGIPDVVSVASDSGMMGGKISHEFMMLTPVGEDSIVICQKCNYRANLEAAESLVINDTSAPPEPLNKVHTPGTKTINDVCEFLRTPIQVSCKAVVYQKAKSGEYVVVFTRGDLDTNETKISNHLQEEIHPATITETSSLIAGYMGPINLKGAVVLFDSSLKGINSLCCGANEVDYHYTGFNIERDYGPAEYHDFSKVSEGGICPTCKEPALTISRGIEVGNIFQLGDKYTRAMDMKYTDEAGNLNYPVMGCYGIGVGRLAASVCEAKHDDYGPIWPMSIAPWQVHVCCVRASDAETKVIADDLYSKLKAQGIEVIYDDRPVSAGVMFSDADLLGVPVRVIVSPRNIKESCLEIMTRDKAVSAKVEIGEAVSYVKTLVCELLA
ncbi:MAG: proline--tRNA ligase [Defluviitaleaceae bacterium]|nr:proline--tRNA ligase [Defluviitaleaceae bacterium]